MNVWQRCSVIHPLISSRFFLKNTFGMLLMVKLVRHSNKFILFGCQTRNTVLMKMRYLIMNIMMSVGIASLERLKWIFMSRSEEWRISYGILRSI